MTNEQWVESTRNKVGLGFCDVCKKEKKLKWSETYCRTCYRAVDRKRYYKKREEKLAYLKDYFQKNKEKVYSRTQKTIEKYPEKNAARIKLRTAVSLGKLKKLPCEVCGEKKVHGHHEDYSKPLEVKWLCVKHHYEKHRKYKIPSVG